MQIPLQPTAASFVPAQHIANHLAAAENSVDSSNYSPMCLLKTAVASVKVGHNKVQAYVLINEGAQRSFITQSLASQLGSIPHFRQKVLISSFGGDTSKQHAGVVHVTLETNLGDVSISALVVPTIASPLHMVVNPDVSRLPHLSGLKLAHPVNTTDKFDISLFIGVDHYWKIVGNHIVGGNGPTAMQSKLGYLLSWPLPQQLQPSTTGVLQSNATDVLQSNATDVLHAYITQEFPECPHTTSSLLTSALAFQQDSTQPSESLRKFYQCNYISRDSNGSYTVGFLRKQDHFTLPTNLMVCKRQTRNLAKRLGHQPELLKLYNTTIVEQEKCGFIEKVNPSEIQNKRTHYIPHHPVHKNSQTTPD